MDGKERKIGKGDFVGFFGDASREEGGFCGSVSCRATSLSSYKCWSQLCPRDHLCVGLDCVVSKGPSLCNEREISVNNS